MLAQTGCALEIIVIDDGSTDATAEVLAQYVAKDMRLRVLRQANAGLTRALVQGCEMARGDFIARHDVGDVSLPGRVERQLNALRRQPDLAFVSCGTRYVEPQGAFLYHQHGTGIARVPTDIIDIRQPNGVLDGPSHHGSVMFRADSYRRAGGYRPEFYFGQDWDLWYRLGQIGRFQMLDETLYEASVGLGDISTSNRAPQEELAAFSLLALKMRMEGRSDAPVLARAALVRPATRKQSVSRRHAQASYFLGECLRKNGDNDRAREYLLQCLGYDRLHVQAWVRLAQIALGGKSRARSG
jgi:glycosyltransferase involved in cell wall biosynthesis